MTPLLRRPSQPPRTLRHLLVNAVGVTVVAAGVTALLLPAGLDVTNTGDSTVHARLEPPGDARVQALMKRYHCSTEGFGNRQVPRSSIIRTADGRVAVVSFDRGWRAFQKDGAGSLVAVCLRPPPR